MWEVDDEQTDILLATLNRLGGTDRLDKKLALLRRLSKRTASIELGKLLPQTAKQIERLSRLERPRLDTAAVKVSAVCFANPMVFFLDDTQRQIIENAISLAGGPEGKVTKAAKKAVALTTIAQNFLNNLKTDCGNSAVQTG